MRGKKVAAMSDEYVSTSRRRLMQGASLGMASATIDPDTAAGKRRTDASESRIVRRRHADGAPQGSRRKSHRCMSNSPPQNPAMSTAGSTASPAAEGNLSRVRRPWQTWPANKPSHLDHCRRTGRSRSAPEANGRNAPTIALTKHGHSLEVLPVIMHIRRTSPFTIAA